MNEGQRRRRRLDDGSSGGGGGGWFPVLALAVIVILIGLALGAAAARFFGNHSAAPQPSALPTVVVPRASVPTIVPQTPLPAPSPSPKPKPAHTPRPQTTPTAAPTATPTAVPTASPTPAPRKVVTPQPSAPATTPKPAIYPAPKPTATLRRAAPRPVATPRPAATTPAQRAEEVVRLYLDAMAAGDVAQARSYLANGSPDETFMNRTAHVNYIRQNENGNGTYAVNADVTTDTGEYFFTFTVDVSPGGAVILDHTAIKP